MSDMPPNSFSAEAQRDEPLRPGGGAPAACADGSARRPWPTVAAAVVLIAAGIAVYAGSFQGQFVYDDLPSIIKNRDIRHLWPPWAMLLSRYYYGRPLLGLTLAANYAAGGLDVRGYHAVNVAIHLLAALTLFGIVRRTLREEDCGLRIADCGFKDDGALRANPQSAIRNPQLKDRDADGLAFAVALLWVIHPLQTQAVTYIIQRGESLMGLFYLLTLYAVLRAATVRLRRGAWAWSVVAVAACALGMATKQVMITAPLVVFFFDWTILAGSWREALRRRWGLYLGLAATWLVLAPYVFQAGASVLRDRPAGPVHPMPTPWEYLRSEPGVLTQYLSLVFWPRTLCLDYGWPVARTVSDVLPPAMVMALLLGAALWATRRRPAIGFLGLAFFLVLAPTSSLVPMEDLAFEHRMYLPLAAVVTAAVVGAYWLGLCAAVWGTRRVCGRVARRLGGGPGRGTPAFGWALAGIALAAAAVPLGYRTVLRNADYRSPLQLWEKTVQDRPDNGRAHSNYGVYLYQAGDVHGAIRELDKAIALKRVPSDAYYNRGSAYQTLGQLDAALRDLSEAIALNPGDAEAHNNRGNVYQALGRQDEALRDYTRAIELDPEFAEAYNNRGLVWHAKGRADLALQGYARAIELKPDYPEAYNNRGVAYQALGRLPEALRAFSRSVELNPTSAGALFNRGNAYMRSLQYDQAIADFTQALRRQPNLAAAYAGRASCYTRLKVYDRAWADVAACRKAGGTVTPEVLKALQEASGVTQPP